MSETQMNASKTASWNRGQQSAEKRQASELDKDSSQVEGSEEDDSTDEEEEDEEQESETSEDDNEGQDADLEMRDPELISDGESDEDASEEGEDCENEEEGDCDEEDEEEQSEDAELDGESWENDGVMGNDGHASAATVPAQVSAYTSLCMMSLISVWGLIALKVEIHTTLNWYGTQNGAYLKICALLALCIARIRRPPHFHDDRL